MNVRMISIARAKIYSEEFLEHGDKFEGDRIFYLKTEGDDIECVDEMYLLPNGWLEVVYEGVSEYYPPSSVLWASGE
jgi:hypothetical protein